MITRYGMSKDFDMVAMEVQTNQYLGGDSSLTCSSETQKLIDEKVVELVRRQHEKAAQILLENRENWMNSHSTCIRERPLRAMNL